MFGNFSLKVNAAKLLFRPDLLIRVLLLVFNTGLQLVLCLLLMHLGPKFVQLLLCTFCLFLGFSNKCRVSLFLYLLAHELDLGVSLILQLDKRLLSFRDSSLEPVG